MKRLRAGAIVAAATAVLVGCSSIKLPIPCDLMIIAAPADSGLRAGDPVPPGALILAAPSDFDMVRSSITSDPNGANVLNLQLRGPAVARLAGHTGAHVGEQVAIVINGEVVTLPVIESSIPTGEISIIPAAIDNAEFAKRFAGCVR